MFVNVHGSNVIKWIFLQLSSNKQSFLALWLSFWSNDRYIDNRVILFKRARKSCFSWYADFNLDLCSLFCPCFSHLSSHNSLSDQLTMFIQVKVINRILRGIESVGVTCSLCGLMFIYLFFLFLCWFTFWPSGSSCCT